VVGALGEIKAKYHINANRWNATRDYNEPRDPVNTRIAVIGDSYIEAFQVPPAAAMPAMLEKGLMRRYERDNLEVYSFGISGASLSHYLAIMRYVRRKFQPDLYIINIIHNDFQDSLAAPERAIFHSVRGAGDTFEEVQPQKYQPSSIRRIVGVSAVARYLVVNLKLLEKIPTLAHTVYRGIIDDRQFEANINVSKMNLREMKGVVEYILKKYLQEVDGDTKKLMFVIDAPRNPIYEGTHPKTTRGFQYNELTAEVCHDLFLHCLDLTEPFWQDFQKNKRRFNSEIDGHWNEYGHGIAAQQIEDFLHERGLLSAS
jgi:hypothetical protein